ncbi:MAG: TetR/AcrR family transcriptional regulator [Marinobacter sp.]|nr:TetR/AcrR family transcriptional regulator [Marinobacter sp.]
MSRTQSRREQEKQQRHEAILDAAEATFFGQGYERTSMDDIAKAANLSRALLYVYFKDKAAIQRGIMLRAGQSLQARFRAALESGSTGLAQIAAIGRAYYDFSLEEPDYFDALTRAATALPGAAPEQAQLMGECETLTMGLMVQAIRNGLEDGSLDSQRIQDPVQTALYLRGALHGVIMLCQQEMAGDGPLGRVNEAALIAHTMQMLMASLIK